MLHSSPRHMARCAAALVLATAWASATATGPTVARGIDAQIRASLGVSGYTLQSFVPPPGAEEGFEAVFDLGGVETRLRFVPTEIHTEDCVMSVDIGAAKLIDLPPPPAGIFDGGVEGGRGTAVAQMLDGRLSALVVLPDRTWFIQPLTDAIPGADPTMHVVVASEHNLGDGHRCGLEGDTPGASSVLGDPSGHGHEGPTVLQCEVACESDFQFSDLHSLSASATAQDIARVMAWTSKYFTQDVGVKFKITKYVIRLNALTNPYSSSIAGDLLAEFEAHWNLKFFAVQRDTTHLFTGRDLNGGTIGIARLGVICNTTAAYGLSQSLFSPQLGKRASLTAHEIGHNFNARHCDDQASPAPWQCAPCRIMLAAITPLAGPLVVMSFGCSGPFIAEFAQQLICLDPLDGPGATCRPDLNFDAQLTVADFAAFQTAFVQGLNPIADFNHDGQLTGADFGAFQSAYAAGCP